MSDQPDPQSPIGNADNVPPLPKMDLDAARKRVTELCPTLLNEIDLELSDKLGSAICADDLWPDSPCYSCVTCAQDNTTVMCKECFDNSGHKDHLYRISTSSGCGSCDCGDTEAWKTAPGCNLHHGTDSHTPEEVRELCGDKFNEIVCKELPVLFKLLQGTLLLTDVDNFGYERRQVEMNNDDKFCLIIFNDEINTFGTVNNLMKKFMTNGNLSDEFYKYTNYVSEIGGVCMFKGTYKSCVEADRQILNENFWYQMTDTEFEWESVLKMVLGEHRLRTEIVHESHYDAYLKSYDMLFVLNSLNNMQKYLIAGYLLNIYMNTPDSEFVEWYIEHENELIKTVRKQLISLLSTPCLKFAELRVYFARLFSYDASKILEKSLHSLEHKESFLFDLHLQIYTVRSVVCDLLSRSNFLSEFFDVLDKLVDSITNKDLPEREFYFSKLLSPINALMYSIKVLGHEKVTESEMFQIFECYIRLVEWATEMSKRLGTINLENPAESSIKFFNILLIHNHFYELLEDFASLLSQNKSMLKLAIKVAVHHFNLLIKNMPSNNLYNLFTNQGFQVRKYKIKVPFSNYPLMLISLLIPKLIQLSEPESNASDLIQSILIEKPDQNRLIDPSSEFSTLDLEHYKVKDTDFDSLFIYLAMVEGHEISTSIYTRNSTFVSYSHYINCHQPSMTTNLHSLRQFLMCFSIEQGRLDLSNILTIFNSFYVDDITNVNFMTFCAVRFIMSLIYHRRHEISDASIELNTIEYIVQSSIINDSISRKGFLDLIENASSIEYHYIFDKVLKVKSVTSKKNFFEPNEEFIGTLTFLHPGLCFTMFQHAMPGLAEYCAKKKINYCPMKPPNFKPIMRALEEFSQSSQFHQFMLSFFNDTISQTLHQPLFYLYACFGLLTSPNFREYLKDYQMLSSAPIFNQIRNDISEVLKKSFDMLLHDQTSNNQQQMPSNSLQSDSSNNKIDVSSKVRKNKLERIAEMQQKFKRVNPDLFAEKEIENVASAQSDQKNVFYSPENVIENDFTCMICQLNERQDDLSIDLEDNFMTQSICPPAGTSKNATDDLNNYSNNKNRYWSTCGHFYHYENCGDIGDDCAVCGIQHRYYNNPTTGLGPHYFVYKKTYVGNQKLSFDEWIRRLGDAIDFNFHQPYSNGTVCFLNTMMYKTEACIRKEDDLLNCYTDYQLYAFYHLQAYGQSDSASESIMTHHIIGFFLKSNIEKLMQSNPDITNSDQNLVKLIFILLLRTESDFESGLGQKYLDFLLKYLIILLAALNKKEIILPAKSDDYLAEYKKLLTLDIIGDCDIEALNGVGFDVQAIGKTFSDSLKSMVTYFDNTHLIQLPSSFAQLQFDNMRYFCPTYGTKANKILCLICGEVMCFPGNCCADTHEIYNEIEYKLVEHCEHNNAIGINLSNAKIYMRRPNNESLDVVKIDGPYLDSASTPNIIGNKLLDKSRYKYIENLWFEGKLSQFLPKNSRRNHDE